jgi:hypothetical protein
MNEASRHQLARQIADTPGAVAREGDAWLVRIRPTGDGSEGVKPLTFRVRPGREGRPASCTCPSFKRSNAMYACEHILAVLYAADSTN